jgi:hypothetical protein
MPSGFFTVLMKSTTLPEIRRHGVRAAYSQIEPPPSHDLAKGFGILVTPLIAMGGEMRRLRLGADYR